MANVKITELTAATALAGTDVLPIVDVGADATKKVSVSDLLRNLPDGTASAPALAFADDQNSGILSPAENELAFATSGTQRLLIDSSGKFAFGTSTVSTAKFTFNSAGTNEVARFESTDAGAYLSLKDSTSSSSNFIEGGADQLSFGTNSNERLRIDSNGRVGIGTTSPENNLHIADTSGPIIRLTNSTGTDGTYTGRISTGDAAGTFFAGINFFKHDTNDGEIRFRTKVDGTNQDTVTIVDGRVGIGTSSPDKLLHLAGADTAIIRLENTDTSLTANQIIGGLEFEKTDGSGAGAGVVGGLRMYSEGAVGESAYLTLSTASSSTNNAERMRIDSSGRVGIGTSSPAAKLEIGGIATSGQTEVFTIDRSDGTQLFSIDYNVTGNAVSLSGNNKNFVFKNGSSSSETMRIDSSGEIDVPAGIGPQIRFENQHSNTADAAISTFDDGAGTLLCLGSNFYFSGAGAETRYNTSEESAGILINRTGVITFLTNGTSATATERMRIDSSGNVGIKSTNPLAQLHILNTSGTAGFYLSRANGTAVGDQISIQLSTDSAKPRITGYGDGLSFFTAATSGTASERMRLTSNGLTFNGDTAAANALDDYEEGTWTATLNTTNGNATVSASNTTGYYVKVGSMVHAHYYTSATSVTAAGTGSAIITGLPFTVASLTNGFPVATVTHTTIFTSQVQNGYADPGNTRIVLW